MPVLCKKSEVVPPASKGVILRRASSPCLLGDDSPNDPNGYVAPVVPAQRQQQRPIKSCMSVPSLDQSLRGASVDDKDKSEERNNQQDKPSESNVDKIKRSVSFHAIQVREYPMTLGDHPGAKSGPPVTLSWEYNASHASLSVDEFETYRPPRRSRSQIYIPSIRREEMLNKEFGIGRDQIRKAKKEVSKIRQQREKTVATLHNAKMEEAMEKARRKITRFVGRNTKKKEESRLWKEAERIAEERAREERRFAEATPIGAAQTNHHKQIEDTVEDDDIAELPTPDYIMRKDFGVDVWPIDDTVDGVDDDGPLAF